MIKLRLNNIMKYKILTNNGFKEFTGIRRIPNNNIIELIFNDNKLSCTIDHKIFIDKKTCKNAGELKIGDKVFTKDGYKEIIDIKKSFTDYVYDILDVDGNKFYANDILVHNCEFVGKSNSLIDTMILRQKILQLENTTYKFVVDNDIRFYKDIEPYKKYLIGVDTSMGVTGDFSAIEVFEFPGFKQVAEWKSDALNQNDQIIKLKTLVDWIFDKVKSLGNGYPEIYWSVENNGSAEGFICALREIERHNNGKIFIKKGTLINEDDSKRVGFTTTKVTKHTASSQFKILFEMNKLEIFSREFLIQLSNYSLKDITSTSFAASSGHDDLISASLIVIMMYLQIKNRYDLDREIIPMYKNDGEKVFIDDTPFLFFNDRL